MYSDTAELWSTCLNADTDDTNMYKQMYNTMFTYCSVAWKNAKYLLITVALSSVGMIEMLLLLFYCC